MEENRILNEYQFGFRRNRSVTDALQLVKNYIVNTINSKKIVCMILQDIKNVFNSVNRNGILRLMEKYKVPYRLKFIISAYLNNRKIKVTEEKLGVLQGSSMGPILWLLIMNKLLMSCQIWSLPMRMIL